MFLSSLIGDRDHFNPVVLVLVLVLVLLKRIEEYPVPVI
jgi:hypothetical protein